MRTVMRFPSLSILLIVMFMGASSLVIGADAGDESERVIDTMQSSRNEDSVPPESILPSSPAIATHPNGGDVARVLRAKAVLSKLGYDVGRFDEVRSAKLKAAIFRFQKAHGLQTTGNLDPVTLKALGMKSR